MFHPSHYIPTLTRLGTVQTVPLNKLLYVKRFRLFREGCEDVPA
jgi:hypothetical protein